MTSVDLIPGIFIKFEGMTKGLVIYGYVCQIDEDGYVNYIRDSLSKWSATKKGLLKTSTIITENEFYERVRYVFDCGPYEVPSDEEIKLILDLFKQDFDADYPITSKIKKLSVENFNLLLSDLKNLTTEEKEVIIKDLT